MLASVASDTKKNTLPRAEQILDGVTLLVPPGSANDYLKDLEKAELHFANVLNKSYWQFLIQLESQPGTHHNTAPTAP